MRCAKREPGRSWEAVESEMERLGECSSWLQQHVLSEASSTNVSTKSCRLLIASRCPSLIALTTCRYCAVHLAAPSQQIRMQRPCSCTAACPA